VSMVSKEKVPGLASSGLGFGLDPFGGAFANAAIIPVEAVLLIVVVDLVSILRVNSIMNR
jgi:hypothetical protein